MQLAIIITQKVTRDTSHHLHFSICSKCSPAAQTQVVDIDTICRRHVQYCMTQAAHLLLMYHFSLLT